MLQQSAVAGRDSNMFVQGAPKFSGPRTKPLEVIIVGLSRTGTTSMLEAMKVLGYGDIWNTRTMLRNHQTVFCGNMLNTKITGVGPKYDVEHFESLFGEHTCISGEFVSMMAQDLIEAYPDAKIILTVRQDEQRWLQSILDTMWYNYSTWAHSFLRRVHPIWQEQAQLLNPFWHGFYCGDPASYGLRVYREHSARVQRVTQPPERLLVFQVSEGWGPLCKFLGKEVPDTEFPKTNSVAEHRALFGGGRTKALRGWVLGALIKSVVPACLAGLLWFRREQVALLLKRAWH